MIKDIRIFKKNKISLLLCAALSINTFEVLAEDKTDVVADDMGEVITIVGHKITELNEENNGGALGNRSVLETPFSVDVISLEDMELRQVNTLSSLFSREASVSVDGSPYSSFGDTIRVRGLGLSYTDSFKVNGMSVNTFSGELPYEAFEQVTLIKGSTGFLYGMAAPGGIVNYVTKKAHEDAVSASVGFRSDSVLSAHVDASTRFGENDNYGLRVNVVKEEGDTYLEGGGIDRETLSIAFDAQLLDSLTWTADFIYNDRLIDESWNRFTLSLDDSEPLPDTVEGSRNLGIDGTFDEYKSTIALTGLAWEINEQWTASVDYAYTRNETKWIKPLVYLTNSEGDLDISTYEQFFDVDYDQIQALLTGEFETGSIKHNLVVGASLQEATTYRNDGGEYGRKVTWGYGVDNLFTPVDLPTYEPSLLKDAPVAWVDTQRSFFISDFISITDQWEVLLGMRSTEVEHKVGEYFLAYQDNHEDNALSPTAALMYKPDADTTYYASYVESFEGTTSAVGDEYANANELLEPLESLQYELGLKMAGAGWSINSALFRIERGATLVTDANELVQDGITIYQGIEFSGALEVTNNLSLYGDIMVLDTEYNKTSSGVEGNNVSGAPQQQLTLQSNYNVASVPGLTFNLGGKYHGKTAIDSNNNWELPAYTLFYGGVSYSTAISDQNVTVIGTIDNILDEEYWANGDSYGGGNLRIGEPRTFAVKVKVDF